MLEKVNIACKNKQNTNKREQKEREKKSLMRKLAAVLKHLHSMMDSFFFWNK